MRHRLAPAIAGLALVSLLAACGPADDAGPDADAAAQTDAVMEVTARDFEFDAPTSVPSGWTTIRFANEGEQEHFVLLWALPEDVTFTRYRAEVVRTFEEVWNRYDSGDLTREETMQALGEELPAYFFEEVRPSSGVALTEPGRTSQTTVRLEPGTYVMECYVKTPQGSWHTNRGMLRELTVTADSSGAAPPEADAELTLSNYEISFSGSLSAGTRTVAVHAADTPEGLVTHDVNLFRLEADTTTVDEIAAWMDWMDLEQFRAPAPGLSLGGAENMTAGATAYVTVDLAPGRYAWVSEGYADRGMVREFTVE